MAVHRAARAPAKAGFAERLEALATGARRRPPAAKLAKLKVPPLAVAVISSPKDRAPIPEWEQVLSSGAVCTTLLYAALAMGYGANWITDWYAYDAEANAILGLKPGERVAGFMLIGTPASRRWNASGPTAGAGEPVVANRPRNAEAQKTQRPDDAVAPSGLR